MNYTEPTIVGLAILFLTLSAFFFGVTVLLSYQVMRMLRSDGWDKSNITNALRLIAHCTMHPEDFVHMWYVEEITRENGEIELVATRRPFFYLSQDELSDVVKTRPKWKERV